jgi:hypothetical protein
MYRFKLIHSLFRLQSEVLNMLIYVRTSNHPAAHTIAVESSVFLDLQDKYWPLTTDEVDGDAYWNFKLELREIGKDMKSTDGAPSAKFTLTRSRIRNEILIERIKAVDDEDRFFAEHDIENISRPDRSIVHTLRTRGVDIEHNIRLQTFVAAENSSEFLFKLEQLLTEYSTTTRVNTPEIGADVMANVVEYLETAE